jgi:prevent-host-death family protein
MGTATIFEARNHFSKMLKRVQEGETITITSGRAKR